MNQQNIYPGGYDDMVIETAANHSPILACGQN